MDSEPAARAPPAWRSARSPLFAEESYLGGINVLDPRQALHLPCRVTGLTVQGNERTRREMIEREMRAAMGARTHAELAAELLNAKGRLYDLDVFREATCHVDVGERDEDVTVRIVVEEKGTHTVSTGTFVHEGEGCLEVAWSLRNFADNAQQVRGAVSGGFPYQSSGVRLDFLQPYLLDKWSLHACLAQTSKLVPRPKKLAQLLQSVSVTVEQREGRHAWTYELSSRRLDLCRDAAPDEAADSAGWTAADLASLKSAVRHTYKLDTRDSKQMPASGYLFKSDTEFAGLLGRGADFSRNQTHGSWHTSAGGGCTLSLWGSFGLLQALNGDVSRYFDRFFLGGPLSLRGFRSRGVGPVLGARDEVRSAKGGEAMLVLGASVSRPLPLPPNLKRLVDARFEVFGNMGNNVSPPGGASVLTALQPLVANMRTAVGMGFIFPTALGRLEISVSKALVHYKEDRTATWSVGLIPD